jgi:hypothetical protein
MPSIYKVKTRHRQSHLKWPLPQGELKDHFTTWSALAAAIVTVLAIVTIPWMRLFYKTQKVAAFTIISLAIATMAFVVCTNVLSQMMFSFNTEIEGQDNDDLAVGVKFVQKMLKYNFLWHVLPLVVVAVLGLAITFMPAPSTLLGKGMVFLTSFLYFCIFVLAWLVTPAKAGKEKVMGWEKIMHVYQKPKSYYFTVVFPIISMLVLVVGNFALYGALDANGMRSF